MPARAIGFLCSLLVLALLSNACSLVGGGDNDVEPTAEASPAPVAAGPSPEQAALARYVETTLQKGFVPDCGQAEPQRDAGKICAVFRGERGNQKAYAMGPIAAEGTQWAILEQRADTWEVVHTPAITRETSGVPGVPWPLRLNTDVVVAGVDPCLNVREGPSINAPAPDCLRPGTRIQLSAGPTDADGRQWWQISGRAGWVTSDFLRYPDAAQ